MSCIPRAPHGRRGLCAAALLCCALTADPASAQTVPRCEPAVLTLTEAAKLLRVTAAELERLAEQGALPARRIGSAWRFNCDAVMAWLSVEAGRLSAVSTDAHPLLTRTMAEITAAGTAQQPVEKPTSESGRAPQAQNAPIGDKPEERDAGDMFLRDQRVLLRRGEMVVDLGQFYSRSGDRLLAAVDGAVALTSVEQETFTTLIMGRVGIFAETEFFASTTFHNQDVRQFLGNTTLASSGRSDFGGSQLGVRRTLLREGVGRPDIVMTVLGQLPTGDTSYAAGGGVVVIKSVDPVVLFANANYMRSFGEDLSAAARVQPENSVDVSLGYGLALNDTLAISMAVSGVFSGRMRLDETTAREVRRFSARFGLTSWLGKGLYIEPSVSFGLSGPGEGFAFGISLPYTF